MRKVHMQTFISNHVAPPSGFQNINWLNLRRLSARRYSLCQLADHGQTDWCSGVSSKLHSLLQPVILPPHFMGKQTTGCSDALQESRLVFSTKYELLGIELESLFILCFCASSIFSGLKNKNQKLPSLRVVLIISRYWLCSNSMALSKKGVY